MIGPASTGIPPARSRSPAGTRSPTGSSGTASTAAWRPTIDGLDPAWRETLLRIARDRVSRHRHPEALAEALREVPRSLPFEGLAELATLDLPALVVASHDAADPGHPYAVAQAYAEALPRARLISEEEGESPLAWQGGKLSREIAAFAAEERSASASEAPPG